MLPLLAKAIAYLVPLLGEAAVAAVRDAVVVDEDERAARVEALLEDAQRHERRALEREALGRHRDAIRQWRRAERAAAKADRLAQ